jgi:membrane associated rhomboid family serine protease
MLPIRDENPHFLSPLVTRALIGANLLTWVAVQGLGLDERLALSICRLGLIPGQLLGTVPSGTPIALGEDFMCPYTAGAAWYTLLTSMFLHGGWLHIAGNLWFLWIFGNNIEDSMGHGRFLVFYLLSGLAAAGLQIAMDPHSSVPMIGASGAIGGVMGAYLILYPLVRVHVLLLLGLFVTRITIPAVLILGYWFVVDNLIRALLVPAGPGGGVAFWAHIGGFLFGALAVPLFRVPELVDRHPHHGWRRRPAYQRSAPPRFGAW